MLLNDQRMKIIDEFLRDYALKITGSEIARKKKLNQKSIANILQELEEQGFLTSEIDGKNKYYFLQKSDNEVLLHFILLIEHARMLHFYKKNPLIKEVLSQIKKVSKGMLVLFGSYAKGIQTKESDLDLFVVGMCDTKAVKRIGEEYGIEINIKEASLSDFKKALFEKDYLITELVKDHLFVRDGELFVSLLLDCIK